MELYLNNIPLKANKWLKVSEMENLQFIWDYPQTDFFTLMIYDIDAPNSSPYIHLLITNIPGNMIGQGEYKFDYMAPKPPKNNPNHQYIVALFGQEGQIIGLGLKQRARFPLETFIEQNALTLLDEDVLEVEPKTYKFF